MLLLDIQRPFDTVEHRILLQIPEALSQEIGQGTRNKIIRFVLSAPARTQTGVMNLLYSLCYQSNYVLNN